MRESALRGNFFRAKAPFGYRKVRGVGDTGRTRITLEVAPEETETLQYVFQLSLEGKGIKEIGKDLNSQGLTNRGTPWHRSSVYWLLTNEASIGTLVWGRDESGRKRLTRCA